MFVSHCRHDNDVALLILKRESSRQVIPLASSDYCFVDEGGCEVQILGWGDTAFRGPEATSIQEAFPTSLRHKECVDAYGTSRVTDTMICAGDLANGGVDSCTLDSGGPMILAGEQVGIISWGVGCGEAGKPGVYMSIPKLLPWINANLLNIGSPPPVANACECADDGLSGGVETGRKGCKQHLATSGDMGFFCMVVGGTGCSSATYSVQFPGAAWKNC